ncbi:MAG TPA: hypothetical protein VFU27_14430, partial [Terriglobales bacterium]|nr:hypothetical protein [Terriglobales bacterium]
MAAKIQAGRVLFLCAVLGCAALLRGDSGASAPALPDPQQVITFLKQSIDWQRGIAGQEQVVTDPADVLFFNDSRHISSQVLQLSFDFGHAYAAYLGQQRPSGTAAATPIAGGRENLAQMAAAADSEAGERQDELDALKRKSALARGRARTKLESRIAALQSEVQLEQTRAQTLRTLVQFAGGAAGTGSLESQVNELERSVSGLETGTKQAAPAAASAAAANSQRPQGTGIIAIAER